MANATDKMANEVEEQKKPGDVVIKLKVIEESILSVQLDLLLSKPETMLGNMFTSGMAKANEAGEYEIYNVKPAILEGVLDYYKTGLITIPENVRFEEMEQACDYLQIPFTEATVQNWKRYLGIMTAYYKQKIVNNLFNVIVITHLKSLAKMGNTFCDVYFVKNSECDYSKKNSSPPVNNKTSVIFYIEDDIFDLFLTDDKDSEYIKAFLASKGFNVNFKVTKGNSLSHILCKFNW